MDADIVIIGAGPSGIQAAIHASRKKASVVMIGKVSNSAASGTHIENYFGLSGTVSGDDLLKNGLAQAGSFGCEHIDMNVVSVEQKGTGFSVVTESGDRYDSKALILATGVSRKKLGIPGEKEFFGKGVSYCAACDCNFYKGKVVVIVGNESESSVSAELMTKYASKVYWASDNRDVSDNLVEKAVAAGVELIDEFPVTVKGNDFLESVVFGSGRIISADGIFIELGGRSSADLAMDLGIMPSADGTLKVDAKCATTVPGIFACGDVAGKPWQIAKAVGQGAIAGLSAAEMIKG